MNQSLPKPIIFLLLLNLMGFYTTVCAEEGFVSAIGIQFHIEQQDARVLSIDPGSLGEFSGIKPGDLITQIDDFRSFNLMEETSLKLQEMEKNDVTLTIQRKLSENLPKTINITLNHKSYNEQIQNLEKLEMVLNQERQKMNYLTIFYLTPTLLRIPVETTGSLDIRLDNPKRTPVDELAFWLHYNPKNITIIEDSSNNFIHWNTSLSSNLSIMTSSMDPSKGDIFVQLKLIHPLKSLSDSLGILQFQSIGKPSNTPIQFRFNPSATLPNTYLKYQGHDVLGKGNDPTDGVIGATIQITSQ